MNDSYRARGGPLLTDSTHVSLTGSCGISSLDVHLRAWGPIMAVAAPTKVVIDISRLDFATPAIAVTLRLGLRHLVEGGFAASGSQVRRSADCCADYLRRMDVFKGLVDFDEAEQFTRHQPFGFRPATDIVDIGTAMVASRETRRCIEEQTFLSDVASSALYVALGEISENVAFHAPATPACIMAQTYRQGGRQEIEIAAGDLGPGIPTALRTSAVHAHRSEEDALRTALEKNVTSVPDHRRGLGLWIISEIVAANLGTLVIRAGRLSLRQFGSSVEVSHGAEWPGTLVVLRLRLDHPLEVPEAVRDGAELDDYETIEL